MRDLRQAFREASGDWANTKATYNFWNSERFSCEDIIDGHRHSTAQRASQEDVILAIQDTSDFNFTHHQGKNWDKGFGLSLFSTICQRIKSPFNPRRQFTRSSIRNFRPTNLDQRAPEKEEEKEIKK